jgi:pimeloyl-ACP methyl ester carboxylesterase
VSETRNPAAPDESGRAPEVRTVDLRPGVRLHYVEQGTGVPIVFIHGGGKDYRYWDDELPVFAPHYRCIAYSRRYAWPNDNGAIVSGYNAVTDAEDLAALFDALSVEPAHIVAASIGGVAALTFALDAPERVRSLVLAEPPVLRWALDLPGGRETFDSFFEGGFRQAGEAFRAGDDERAMAHLVDAFLGDGTFARLPERSRRRAMRGARDWAAQTTSDAPFPDLPRERVRALRTPTLLLTGDRTLPLHAQVDAELARLLPNARRVVIAGATHDLWVDRPEECLAETVKFLDSV